MQSYRDFLAERGVRHAPVQRTEKNPGDLVLTSAARPAERVERRASL